MHGELATDPPRRLQREDLVEIVLRAQRPMRVVGDRRGLGEAAIVVRHEGGQERRGRSGIVEAPHAQLLDEPILQGAVGPFDTALGFWAAGAEEVDVEGAAGAAELRQPSAARRAVAGLHVEDTQPVAVERHRLAVPLEVTTSGPPVVEGGLDRGEAELH